LSLPTIDIVLKFCSHIFSTRLGRWLKSESYHWTRIWNQVGLELVLESSNIRLQLAV